MVMRSRARREECVPMPGKIARSPPRPPFGLAEVPVTVGTSRLSCGKAVKREYSRQFGSHPGESRFNGIYKSLLQLIVQNALPHHLGDVYPVGNSPLDFAWILIKPEKITKILIKT
jgi:hypothetical protein